MPAREKPTAGRVADSLVPDSLPEHVKVLRRPLETTVPRLEPYIGEESSEGRANQLRRLRWMARRLDVDTNHAAPIRRSALNFLAGST